MCLMRLAYPCHLDAAQPHRLLIRRPSPNKHKRAQCSSLLVHMETNSYKHNDWHAISQSACVQHAALLALGHRRNRYQERVILNAVSIKERQPPHIGFRKFAVAVLLDAICVLITLPIDNKVPIAPFIPASMRLVLVELNGPTFQQRHGPELPAMLWCHLSMMNEI